MEPSLPLAVHQFNTGEFYACHDTLEALWMEALDPERRFYQGLLQTAVAYYHLSHRNWRGCVTLLGEGSSKLSDYQPTYAALDIDALVNANFQILSQLHHLTPARIDQLDPALIPQIRPSGETSHEP